MNDRIIIIIISIIISYIYFITMLKSFTNKYVPS